MKGAARMPATVLPAPAGSCWEVIDSGGWRLARFNAQWRERIRQRTALRSLEIGVSSWDFVTDSRSLAWTGRWVSRYADSRRLEVLVDDQVVTSLWLDDAREDTDLALFAGLDSRLHRVRIHFPIGSTLELAGVTADTGASFACVQADRRWCSWGDSITGGTGCPSGSESYVQRAARVLGWPAINRGFGGAGFPDPMTALAIATTEPWDILSIAIGINSAAQDVETPEEFALQYQACLDILARRCPGRPILCISPVVCTMETTSLSGAPLAPRLAAIGQAIRDVVVSRKEPEIGYVDGLELLGEADLLLDEVHPGPAGHAQMAARLAPRLAVLAQRYCP